MGRLGQILHRIGRGIVHIARKPFMVNILNRLGKPGQAINSGIGLLERGLDYYNPYHRLSEQAGSGNGNRTRTAEQQRQDTVARDGRTENLRGNTNAFQNS